MKVIVNNQPTMLSAEGKVEEVFTYLKLLDPKGIALAVNNVVVPKSTWSSYAVKENDSITVIKATQGG